MTIRELSRLNEAEEREIKEMFSQCNSHDGLNGITLLDTSMNFNQQLNTIFLLYQDSKLVSAIILFVPTDKEAEVTAATLPEYRLRGYFSELLKRAQAEVKKYGVSDMLFACDAESSSGKAVIDKLKAKYEFAEYLLKYDNSLDRQIKEYGYKLKLYRAKPEYMDSIIKICMDAFGDGYDEAKSYAEGVLNSSNRQMFLGEFEGKFVAIGSILAEGGLNYIHGLAVLNEYQGKGFGKEMLYGLIKNLLENQEDNITLEVDSENTKAFQFYRNSGFGIRTKWEYYRKPIE